jgi:hypothetical protein
MDRSTIHYYNKNADKLAELYETADMSEINALLVRFLSAKASILEIVCGSGRDAAFLEYLFEFAFQVRDLVAPDGILFLSGSIRNLPSQENSLYLHPQRVCFWGHYKTGDAFQLSLKNS